MSVNRWILPDGVEELLPAEAQRVESLRRSLLDLYQRWGYELVIPPLMEFADSLTVGMGDDIDLLTFRVTDQLTGRMMGLRADITPQAARIDAHSLRSEGVVRLCYAGSVLHTRPKAPLASRSPIQVGAELYGDPSSAGDIEVISLMLETLAAAKLDSITLDLGHVGIYRAAVAAAGLSAEQAQQYFALLQNKAAAELDVFATSLGEAGVSDAVVAQLLGLSQLHGDASVLDAGSELFADTPAVLEAIDELRTIAAAVQARVPGISLYFDLAELRGYHYHTGVVFSALVPSCGHAVAAGGRYDDIGAAFGRARPATGFSLDLKSLLALVPAVDAPSAIWAPAADDAALWQRVQALRAAGERVICALSSGDDIHSACDRQLVSKDGEWQILTL